MNSVEQAKEPILAEAIVNALRSRIPIPVLRLRANILFLDQ